MQQFNIPSGWYEIYVIWPSESLYATNVNNTLEKAIAFIPFFTGAGFTSSSSELDSSELDSSFFIGAFFVGFAEIKSMY